MIDKGRHPTLSQPARGHLQSAKRFSDTPRNIHRKRLSDIANQELEKFERREKALRNCIRAERAMSLGILSDQETGPFPDCPGDTRDDQ